MAIDIDNIIAAVQAARMLKDKDTKAAPQSFDPLLSKFVPLLSDNGATRQVLYAPDGNPISVADNKLAVRAEELETKIEAVRVLLNTLAGEDFATQTTLAQILEKLDGVIDGTTEGKLAVRAAELETAISNLQTALGSQSTAAKQDALAGLIGALDAVAVSDPAASGTVISLLKGLLSQLQAGSPVSVTESSLPAGAATDAEIQTLQEKVDALNTKIDGITDGTTPAKTELTGSIATTISSPVTGIKTVTATAAEVFAGATRKANRRKLIIRNESTALRFRVGKSDVTQQNGFPVEPGATIIFEFDPKTAVPIYAISEGAALKVGVCEE